MCSTEFKSFDSLVVVADCPSIEYIDSLITNPVWKKYSDSAPEEDIPQIVVHFTPESVYLHPKYQDWLAKFGPTTKHLVLNDSCRSLGSEAVLRLQRKLNSIDTEIFPMLYNEGERERQPTFHQDELGIWQRHGNPQKTVSFVSEPEVPPHLRDLKAPVVLGETLLKYCIRPHKGFER